MTSSLRPCLGIGLALVLLIAACGGGASSEPEAVVATPTAAEAAVAEPTEPATDIAMVASSLQLDGPPHAAVRAGETVTIDHLLYNDNASTQSIALKLLDADEGMAVTLGAKSLQMSRHEVVALKTSVVVSGDAQVGDTMTFTVQAILASDISQRSNLQVTLVVTDVATERPNVTDNTAETSTNQRVLAFVVGDDSGDDLDGTSLEVVGGAFRSASTAAEAGFVTYVPFANVTGPDALLYQLCTSDGICDTAVLRVSVNASS